MTEIEFYNEDFFIPQQTDIKQRDDAFKNVILKFAVENKIVDEEVVNEDWTKIGKLYRLTNLKEGKEFTFQVGERNPFNGEIVLAIIRGLKFYSIINYNERIKAIGYSMVSFINNTELVYFR